MILKEDILIIIPTYMREDNQKAYEEMPDNIKKITRLVAHSGRAEILKKNYPDANVVDLGQTNGIADVRQKCIDYNFGYKKLFMIDDNVKFNQKYFDDESNKFKFKKMDNESWIKMINEISNLLDDYCQVSVLDSANAGFCKEKDYIKNSRIYSVNGINVDVCKKHDVTFDKLYKKDNSVFLGEDFYFTLKLLTEGLENIVTTNFTFSHPHGKKGGNSVHRNSESEYKSYVLLQEEFPQHGIVKFWKEYDNSWNVDKDENGSFRYKARFSWKKASDIGKLKRLNNK